MNTNFLWKRRFFTIAIGQSVSLIGSSAVQFVLIWQIAQETQSPMLMSLAGLAAFLPQMLLGPFAGVWIDRMKRKTVVIASDLFTGLIAAVFALLLARFQMPVWSICLVLGIRAISSVFQTPAIQAIMPLLVPPEELMKANGWNQFLQSGAYMLGPVIGALMAGILPLPVLLLTDLAGALIASITMAVTHVNEPAPAHDQYRFGTEPPSVGRDCRGV